MTEDKSFFESGDARVTNISHVARVGLFFVSLLAVVLADAAEPKIIYQYGDKGKIVGVNALVGIEEPMLAQGDNCDQRIAEVVVDEVVYEGASDMITGFRAKKPAPKEWYGIFKIDSKAIYNSIQRAVHQDVQKLINKGARLIVVYQMCGSGGFVSVRDIFKKSAVNNP
jgi:hypothetical protein